MPFYTYFPFKLQAFDVLRRLGMSKYYWLIGLFILLPMEFKRPLLYFFPLILALALANRTKYSDSFFVKYSNIVVIVHLVILSYIYITQGVSDIRSLRALFGAGSSIVLVSLHIQRSSKRRFLKALPIYLYIFLTGSRTLLIGGIIIYLFSLDKLFKYLLILSALTLLFIVDINPQNIEFIYLPNGQFSIHENFRGFEIYSVIYAMINAPWYKLLIGHGFTTEIPLFKSMVINNIQYSSVPIIHNSFFWILYKFGLIGLIAFGYFIFYHISNLRSKLGLLISIIIAGNLVWGLLSFEWILPMMYLFRKNE